MLSLFFLKISGFVSLIGNGALGVFVYLKNPKRPLNIRFAIFSLSIALWSVGSAYVNVIADERMALWALRQSYLFGVFVPPLFFHFVTTYTGSEKKLRILLGLSYAISASLLFFVFSPDFIARFRVLKDFDYRIDQPGPIYSVFAIFFILTVFSTLILLLFFYWKEANSKQKRQLQFIFIGYFFGALAGLEYFLSVFGISKHPPVDDYMLVITFASMSYAIVRYKLLDIEVIIKKTLVFAGLFSFIFGLFSFFWFFLTDTLQRQVNPSTRWWLLAAATAVVALTSRRLEMQLMSLTDRYLFQKEIDYKAMLKDASRQIASIKSLRRLSRLVIAFLVKRARIKNAAVFICSVSGRYELIASRPAYPARHRTLNDSFPLIQRLERIQQPIEREDVKKEIENSKENDAVSQAQEILKFLNEYHTEAVIPSYLGEIKKANHQPHRMLRSFLLLGNKKSDQEYTREDLDVFFTLAQETAVAVENARLYDEAIERNLELQRINQELMDTQSQLLVAERKATMVGFAKAIGHEVNNALVSIDSGAMFARRDDIPELKQIYESQLKDKLPLGIQRKFEKLVDNLEKRAVKSSNGSHRIQVVIQTLTNILKETREGFEEVNFRMLWEEAVAEVNLSTYEENLAGCKIESDIPKNLILRVNQGQIQRVLVNLIKNAYEAMSGVLDRRICVRASYDPDPQFKGLAHIEVEDNGPGIPEELIAKVFAQGFSTKPKPKAGDLGAAGQGQGLFVCKHIVESAHKGTIEVQSTQGQGTVFILRLPAVGSEDAEENPGIG